MHGVKKLLDSLDSHKATGPDNIPTQLLKQLNPELSPALTIIVEASLQQCQVPSDWKTANIVLVHKKGNRSTPSHYRPIARTSVCCKLRKYLSTSFTHIFSLTLTTIEFYLIIQTGEILWTQIFLTIDDLAKNLNNNLQADVHCYFLDFSKAFNKVDHSCLLHKLNNYGIRGSLLSWLENFLTQRAQHVM